MSVHITTQATVISETGALNLPRIGYSNLARNATVVASSEASGFPADAAQRPDTFEYWRPTTLSATWSADLGSAQTVNYVGIASHDLGTKGCTVRVQYSSDNAIWSNASDVAAPDDDTQILLLFPEQSARYWRVFFNSASSPSGEVPTIGVIYVGEVLAMQEPIRGSYNPITLSRETVLHRSLSRGGQFLGSGIRRMGLTGSVSFQHLTAAWIRSDFDPFVESARQYPYFFAWNSEDFPDEVAYVWTPEDIAPQTMGFLSYMQVSWKMTGISE